VDHGLLLIVSALTVLYVRLGGLVAVTAILYGIGMAGVAVFAVTVEEIAARAADARLRLAGRGPYR